MEKDKNKNTYEALYCLTQTYANNNYHVKGYYFGKNIDQESIQFVNKDKKCRFCGKSMPEVKFTSIEHMFSECLGNKTLTSKFNECDTCNNLFSKYENDLATLLGPFLVIDSISGKGGKRSYKSFDYKNRIDNIGDYLEIFSEYGKIDMEKVQNEKRLTFSFDVPPYKPLYIYKSLVKMALSYIPKEYLDKYTKMINYLKDEDLFYGFESFLLKIYNKFNLFDFDVLLLSKKSEFKNEKFPSLIFRIRNNNFCLIAPIFSDEEMLKQNYFSGYNLTLGDENDLDDFIISNQVISVKDNQRVPKSTKVMTFGFEQITPNDKQITNEEQIILEKIKKDREKIR